MSNSITALTEAQEAKSTLDALPSFSEKIDYIRTLRQSWNFETDHEENTESFLFTTDDDSQLTLAIDDTHKTVTCEI